MKRIAIVIFLLSILTAQAFAYEVPDSSWAHPRILLTSAKVTELLAQRTAAAPTYTRITTFAGTVTPTMAYAWGGDGLYNSSIMNAVTLAEAYYIERAAGVTHADWAQMAYRAFRGIIDEGWWYIDSQTGLPRTHDCRGLVPCDSLSFIPEADNGYNTRWDLFASALIYDWCYDGLTTAQRTDMRNWITAWCRRIYLGIQNNELYIQEDDPGSNFCTGLLQGLLACGYATMYDEQATCGSPSVTWPERYLTYARDTLFENQMRWLKNETLLLTNTYSGTTGSGKGGIAEEGWPGYGSNSLEFMATAIMEVMSVEGVTAESLMGAGEPWNIVKNVLFSFVPNNSFGGAWRAYYHGGADEGITTGTIGSAGWHCINALRGLLTPGTTESRVTKWWLDTWLSTLSWNTTKNWQRPLFYNTVETALAPTSALIGDAAHAAGFKEVKYRQTWSGPTTNNDISFWLCGGISGGNHTGNDIGNFRINCGSELVSQYRMLASPTLFPPAGSFWATSGLWVQPEWFPRYGSNCSDGPDCASCTMGFSRIILSGDHGVVEKHYQNTAARLYYSIDVTGAWRNSMMQSAMQDFFVQLTHKDVEWLYLKADSVMIMVDRACTKNADYKRLYVNTSPCTNGEYSVTNEANMEYSLWTNTQPTAYGTGWRIEGTSSGPDLIVKATHPLDIHSSAAYSRVYVSTATPGSVWRMLDTLHAPSRTCVMSHTMKIVPNSGPFTWLTTTNTTGNCAVSAFRSNATSTLDYLVAFSADTAGADDGGFSGNTMVVGYSATAREKTRCIVADLTPNTMYYWSVAGNFNLTFSRVNPGGYTGVLSDSVGIASFDAGVTAAPDDSLYITMPSTTISSGTVTLGGAVTTRNIRYYNHTALTLTGTITVDRNYFFIGSSADSTLIQYTIAPGAMKEITVTFRPAVRGTFSATIITTDPFPQVTLTGIAVGGRTPRPAKQIIKPPIIKVSAFFDNSAGLFGTSPSRVEASIGCVPPTFDTVIVTRTANGDTYVEWKTDSLCDVTLDVRGYSIYDIPWYYSDTTGVDTLSGPFPPLDGPWECSLGIRNTFDPTCRADTVFDISNLPCPEVTPGTFATKAVTTTGATLTFLTDVDAHAHYRYAPYASSSWVYLHDLDDDSLGHSKAITGLTANHARYKWETNYSTSGCDTSSYENQQNFYTTCVGMTPVGGRCCYVESANHCEYVTARSVITQLRWRVGTEAWTELVGWDNATATHSVHMGDLAIGNVDIEVRYIDECGTTSSWVRIFDDQAVNASGHFISTSCGEE